jgi:hypothetical protein
MLAAFIAAHGALGKAYFYSVCIQGLRPDHDAAAEHIPPYWAELNLDDNSCGERESR